MYQLEKPIFFYLLFTIIGVWVLFLLVFIWKKHTQKQFSNSKALKKLSPDRSFFKSWLKVFVLSLAIASLCLALVNPKIGTKIETITRAGVDIVFALDVSILVPIFGLTKAKQRLAIANDNTNTFNQDLKKERSGLNFFNAFELENCFCVCFFQINTNKKSTHTPIMVKSK